MSDFARYVHNPAEAFTVKADAPEPNSNIDTSDVQRLPGGGYRVEVRNGQTVRPAAEEAAPWHLTARDPVTYRPTRDLTDATLVTISGVQGRLYGFYQAGVVDKDASGRYVVPALGKADGASSAPTHTPEPSRASEATPAERASDHAPLDADTIADLDAQIAGFDQSAIEGLTAAGIAAAAGSLDVDDMVNGFMHRTGADRAKAEEVVERGIEAYTRATEGYLTAKLGVDPEDVPTLYAWAREAAPDALREALQRQVYRNGDMSGWREVAKEFYRAVPPDRAWLVENGYETKLGGANGKTVLVKIAGAWHSVKVAAKLGLI